MTDTQGLIDIVPSLVHDFVYGDGTVDDLRRAIEILEDSIEEYERYSHLTQEEQDAEDFEPWVGVKDQK